MVNLNMIQEHLEQIKIDNSSHLYAAEDENHIRYFKTADITIRLKSDLAFGKNTFHPKFNHFRINHPGDDIVDIEHHFSLPDLKGKVLGKEVYRKPPWAIYKNNGFWIYLSILPAPDDKKPYRVAIFNSGHTRGTIYNKNKNDFSKGNLHSLSIFPSDQIFIARVLADREGFYLHSCGVNFNGKGLLFAGHSEAGKSTMANLLRDKAEVLCDDRIIVRKHPEGFKIYGTWSHGDVPDVSMNSASLKAIMFLEKNPENKLIRLSDKKEIVKKMLSCLITPLVTADWWMKTLLVVDHVVESTPCYILKFKKSSEVVKLLRGF
jgi:hypothetical protein